MIARIRINEERTVNEMPLLNWFFIGRKQRSAAGNTGYQDKIEKKKLFIIP